MSQLRNTSPRRIAGLLAAAAALLISATACGGGSDTPATGDDNPGGGMTSAFTAYSECLAKNGVTITMPSGGARMRPSGGPSGLPGGGFPAGAPRPSGSARAGGGGLPGGGFGKPAGVDDATWEKAQQACASVLPSGRPGGNGRGGNGMSPAYRNCLRDNGVTVGQGPLATADPAVQKAVRACQVLAPAASASPAS